MKAATREAFTASGRAWQAMITWQPDASTKKQTVSGDGPDTHQVECAGTQRARILVRCPEPAPQDEEN